MSAIAAIQSRERMIRQWIQQACDANSVPKLAKKIHLEWSTRMTSTAGTACYVTNVIALSTKLYARASLTQRKQLVKHETCHLVCRYKYGMDVPSHGLEWLESMNVAGCVPMRYHDINNAGLGPKRRGDRRRVSCRCTDHWFVPSQIQRIRDGKKFHCQAECKQELRIA